MVWGEKFQIEKFARRVEMTWKTLTMLEELEDYVNDNDIDYGGVDSKMFVNDPWVADPPPQPWLAWKHYRNVSELFYLLCEDYVGDVDVLCADGKKFREDYEENYGKQNEVTNLFEYYKNLKQAYLDSDVHRLLKVWRMEHYPDRPQVREWKREALLREQRDREGGGFCDQLPRQYWGPLFLDGKRIERYFGNDTDGGSLTCMGMQFFLLELL